MSCRTFAAIIAFALCVTAHAHASSNYPTVLHDQYGLKSTPPCTLCHATDAGGPNTVTTFFGRSLLAHGAQGMNAGSLLAALAAMDAEQTDSDGDGIPDIEELREGSDPNDGPGNNLPVPMTGCALSQRTPANPLPLLALAFALGWRRRRARSPKIGRQTPKLGVCEHKNCARSRASRRRLMARALQGAGR